MGGDLVKSPSDEKTKGGGISRQPFSSYGQKFEELCGYYMSIGMSYSDYWDGDCCMTKYYRQKFELEKERMNQSLWLQAVYLYEAMCDVYPLFNPLASKKKAYPFRDEPIPITRKESESSEERRKQKLLENGREAFLSWVIGFNQKFKNERKEE